MTHADFGSALDALNKAYIHYLSAREDTAGARTREAEARERLNEARRRVAEMMDAIWPPIRERCE